MKITEIINFGSQTKLVNVYDDENEARDVLGKLYPELNIDAVIERIAEGEKFRFTDSSKQTVTLRGAVDGDEEDAAATHADTSWLYL